MESTDVRTNFLAHVYDKVDPPQPTTTKSKAVIQVQELGVLDCPEPNNLRRERERALRLSGE